MNSYIGVLLTTHKDQNNNVFDRSVIEKLLEDQPKVPVRINFTGDPIGRATLFRQDGSEDKLLVEFDIQYPNLDELGLYVVPGGHCDVRDLKTGEDGVRVITKYTLTELSLTSTPADQHLAKITDPNKEDVNEQKRPL